MARLNVNPTRAELRILTDRLKMASRGYTLLKEKQDAQIREFSKLIEAAKVQRRVVEDYMSKIFDSYQTASLIVDDLSLQQGLNASDNQFTVKTELEHVLGVKIPSYRVDKADDTVELSLSYYVAPKQMKTMQTFYPTLQKELAKLAEQEKICFMIGQEIISIRRRVNALEFKTIPDLEETISYIKMKIDDSERNQIAKLINLK